MKMKPIIFSIFVLMLFNIGMVMGVAVWTDPLTHEGVTGNYLLNANVTLAADEVLNVTYEYSIDNGATWVMIDSAENTTVSGFNFSLTFATAGITDQSILLNATAVNATGAEGEMNDTSAVSSVISSDVDNGVPTTSYGTDTPNNITLEIANFTVNSATDASVVNCTLSINPSPFSNQSNEATPANSICGFNLGNVPDQLYRYNLTLTDGLNTTILSTQELNIDAGKPSGAPTIFATQAAAEATSNQRMLVGLFLIIAAVYIFGRKGKR